MTTNKRPGLPKVQRTAPERIWLAVAEGEEYRDMPFPNEHGEEICWSTDQPLDVCVPYIRADLAAREAYGSASAQPTEPPAQVTEAMVKRALKVECPDWVRVRYGYRVGWTVGKALALEAEENEAVVHAALTAALRAREGQ